MNVNRLKWATRNQRLFVGNLLHDVVSQWRDDWSTVPADGIPKVVSTSDPTGQRGEWTLLGCDDESRPGAWIMTSRKPLLSTCADWLGLDEGFVRAARSDCIIDHAVRSASESLLDGLRGALGLRSADGSPWRSEEVAPSARPWTGAASYDISFASSPVHIVVHGGVIAKLSPAENLAHLSGKRTETHKTSARVPILTVMSSATLSASVTLRPVEVTLEDIAALSPGDVIKTTHRLDEPLQLKNARGTPISGVVLGSSDGRRCIRLGH